MSGATQKFTHEQVETMEVFEGFAHEKLEGWVPPLASDNDLRLALEKAFDYRGDVTLTLKDGRQIEAYIFNRVTGQTLADSKVTFFSADVTEQQEVTYADIAALAFTGKDRAAGKQWEDWIRKYNERKAAGEKGIALQPESLD